MDDAGAAMHANSALGVAGKDFARCLIAGNREPMLLSVPVAGGAHSLARKGAPESVRLSDHGNWRHTHLGAIEAAYGRMPYYQHVAPLLHAILSDTPQTLRELSLSLHGAITEFLDIPETIPEAEGIIAERGRELAESVFPELSIADMLMRLGKESLVALAYLASEAD